MILEDITLAYLDIFLETDLGSITDQHFSPYLPEELQVLYISNTPPFALPNGKKFYFTRVPEKDVASYISHPAIKPTIVGKHWDEIAYRPYRYRDLLFNTTVTSETGETVLVPMAKIKRLEDSVNGVAVPWSLFAGDDVSFKIAELPDVEQATSKARDELLRKLDAIEAAISSSNSLIADDRERLNRDLSECKQLTNARLVDHEKIATRLSGVRDFCLKIAQSVIAKVVLDAIGWLWENWHRLP
jgi:hypothetical protein